MLKGLALRKGSYGIGVSGEDEPGYVGPFRKCYADEPLVMPLKGIHVDDKLQFMEEPFEIMEREIKRLKRSRIPLVKVRWNSRGGPKFTWEREDSFKQKYPQLFTNRASLSTTRFEGGYNRLVSSGHHKKQKSFAISVRKLEYIAMSGAVLKFFGDVEDGVIELLLCQYVLSIIGRHLHKKPLQQKGFEFLSTSWECGSFTPETLKRLADEVGMNSGRYLLYYLVLLI
ncbi:hypothetical protein Tco_0482073 [Tanacetum coccineum]